MGQRGRGRNPQKQQTPSGASFDAHRDSLFLQQDEIQLHACWPSIDFAISYHCLGQEAASNKANTKNAKIHALCRIGTMGGRVFSHLGCASKETLPSCAMVLAQTVQMIHITKRTWGHDFNPLGGYAYQLTHTLTPISAQGSPENLCQVIRT